MPRHRSCVSINGRLYRRFRKRCESTGHVVASVADVLVWSKLDELEADPAKLAEFVANVRRPIRRGRMPTFSVRALTYFRISHAAKAKGERVREFGEDMINAMLDAAGAK